MQRHSGGIGPKRPDRCRPLQFRPLQFRQRRVVFGICAALLVGPSTLPPPAVHDGDTLTLHGTVIRLWGADAPELAQTCSGIPAGIKSRDALAALVLRGVRCERAGPPSYGRTVARCTVPDHIGDVTNMIDVGAALVRAGMAWDTSYSGGAYADAEREAREAGRGVWGWGCVRAEVWRAEH